MRDERLPAFERFLVEDVILTLGNLRGVLAWLGEPAAAAAHPEIMGAGLERVGRQIEMLEDRARTVCREIRGHGPVAAEPALAAYAEGSGVSLEEVLRDALGAEGIAVPAPVFRTRRVADG